MTKEEKLHFYKGDWLAIGIVVMIASLVLLCFFRGRNTPAAYAQIYMEGKLIQTLPLNQNTTLSVTGQYTNEITVSDGAIAFTNSDCPGQDCVHSGSIRNTGRSLICLPNAVEIRVISGASDVDFVVR